MKYIFYLLVFQCLPYSVCSQVAKPFVVPIPVEISRAHHKIITDSIVEVSEIDFTGNGKKDFLITSVVPGDGYVRKWLWWVRDDFTVYRKLEIGIGDCELWKYINLDKDPELEIVTAWGYEDGIDYSIADPDYESDGLLKHSILFNPVVKYRGEKYWGYPWDWESLSFDQVTWSIEVLLDHTLKRDGNVDIPETYKMPVVFFQSNHESSMKMTDLNGEPVWVTLSELFEQLK